MGALRAVSVGTALLLAPVSVVTGCDLAVTGPSLVLRLASPDKSDDGTAAPIRQFVEEVDRRSGGTIRVDPIWDVAPAGTHDWDQVTAGTVVEGTYELGLVPGRAFDVLGVDSLRALNTPFLVTSQAATRAVLASDLRDDLMAGLPNAGLVGIDVFPDGLRHPFGYAHPMLGAEDYEGALVRAATSDTVGRLFAALGASVTDEEPRNPDGGAEAQFSVAPAGTQTSTGNITFFPKTNVLIANQGVADRLRRDQWQVLVDAGAATREWQFARLPSDREAAAAYCRGGGVIVSASAEQVAGLEAKAAAVSDWLARDPGTRRLIDRIGRLVSGESDGEPLTTCPGRTPGGATSHLSVLDGTYRSHIRRRDLVAAGVTNENLILENTGRITFTLRAGRWRFDTEANHFVANPTDTGRYEIVGQTFTFFWEKSAGAWTRMTFRVGPDGTVHFTDILDGDPEAQALSEGYFGVPWAPVGKQPA